MQDGAQEDLAESAECRSAKSSGLCEVRQAKLIALPGSRALFDPGWLPHNYRHALVGL
jgi:hypothetical protein